MKNLKDILLETQVEQPVDQMEFDANKVYMYYNINEGNIGTLGINDINELFDCGYDEKNSKKIFDLNIGESNFDKFTNIIITRIY